MIAINGYEWAIRFVNPYSRYLRRSDGSYTIGMTDWNTRTMYIADNLNDYMVERVICHELCHALSMSYGLYLDIDTEEMICSFMEQYGREVIMLLDYVCGYLT